MDNRITNVSLSTLLRSLADLLMPRECAVCGRQLLASERHLCLVCEAGLPLTHFEALRHNPMADKFNALVEAPCYEQATALFYYSGDYRKITQALKYGRNFGLGRRFAAELGHRLAASPLWSDVDLVCCVPLHWTRRWTRGYNQAAIIARQVALALAAARASQATTVSPAGESNALQASTLPPAGESHALQASVLPTAGEAYASQADSRSSVPPAGHPFSSQARPAFDFARFAPRLLRRTRRTGTQTRLAAEGRLANVLGAFAVRPRVAQRLLQALARTQKGGDLSTNGTTSPSRTQNGRDLSTNGEISSSRTQIGGDLSTTGEISSARTQNGGDLSTGDGISDIGGQKRPCLCTETGNGVPTDGPRHILIIDDVFTTGATLAACHAALRQAFGPAVRISAATLAFVD